MQVPNQSNKPGSEPPKPNAGFIVVALIIGLVCVWQGVCMTMQGGKELLDMTQQQPAATSTGTTGSATTSGTTTNPSGPIAAQKYDGTAGKIASTAVTDATFTTEDFSIRYPAAWQKIPLPVTTAGKILDIRTLNGAVNALITTEPAGAGTTADVCADSVVKSTQQVLTNFELVSRSPIQLKPFKGVRVVIKGNINPPKGQTIRCQQDIVVFVTNKKAYCVAFTAWDRWAREFQPVFKNMIDSIDSAHVGSPRTSVPASK